ncbi:two-component sensor histidine kinase [Lachnoclostridium sp. An169]|uniref:sensor histidine kinase n=1 Tax=Lachnoclostridium sp. An169 TaxID=1965569 RepID=UPI000B3684E3|nr:HAMP domain-containing sensor histidine kinase [Lachnoclostridium sp. An169]OUP86629.1 two-component sensor histidine kinase [Lachnoclostridium sp. An169]
MKSFGTYISKHLASFAVFLLIVVIVNIILFGLTFYHTVSEDYGESSPRAMLEMISDGATAEGLTDDAVRKLRQYNIWAMYLTPNGKCFWTLDVPEEVPQNYNVQDVASFSKGYLEDYPVFVWNTDEGLLVLGYPKNSYMKLTSNYYSVKAIQKIPLYVTGMLGMDVLCLFLAYYFSKRRIIQNTEPIVEAIETLADGKPASLHIDGELSEIAGSVNKASQIISRQNEARANWISGVSHDIRTPLSMIMGYAGRIAADEAASDAVREQAEIVRRQSVKIKELVQDLNLVSQLEYEMQPLHKEQIRLSKLIRSCAAELLNSGISDDYTIEIDIAPEAENAMLECDARLISRAINNLVQNSIKHNPQGCRIRLSLKNTGKTLILTVADNGVGLTPEKLQELEEKPHYMESTDERLDLRHGLGLLLVRQIVEAHGGSVRIDSISNQGYQANLSFQTSSTDTVSSAWLPRTPT